MLHEGSPAKLLLDSCHVAFAVDKIMKHEVWFQVGHGATNPLSSIHGQDHIQCRVVFVTGGRLKPTIISDSFLSRSSLSRSDEPPACWKDRNLEGTKLSK